MRLPKKFTNELHRMPSQMMVDTVKVTDANWSMPSEPTRRMPCGDSRRSAIKKTAIVGAPIVSTQSMPPFHTEMPAPIVP